MSYVKQTFWLAGMAAAITLAGSLPAHADSSDLVKLAEVTPDTAVTQTVQPAASPVVPGVQAGATEVTEAVQTPVATEAKLLTEPTATVTEPSVPGVSTTNFQSIPVASISDSYLQPGTQRVAQVSRGSYGSVSPAYLGIGGNLGLGMPIALWVTLALRWLARSPLGPGSRLDLVSCCQNGLATSPYPSPST
jgi:hypothetical protein